MCVPVLSCSTCHPTSTYTTRKQAPWAAVVKFPVTPLRIGPFFGCSRHNNINSSANTAVAELTFFLSPGWNLTSELHLHTGSFRSLHSSESETAVVLLLYTILNNCLCCWCFAEPGVVSECSAVYLWFPLLLALLQDTIHWNFEAKAVYRYGGSLVGHLSSSCNQTPTIPPKSWLDLPVTKANSSYTKHSRDCGLHPDYCTKFPPL